MTKSELKQAIIKVAQATSKTEQEITNQLASKDDWTWFLIREAAK